MSFGLPEKKARLLKFCNLSLAASKLTFCMKAGRLNPTPPDGSRVCPLRAGGGFDEERALEEGFVDETLEFISCGL